MSVIKGGNFTDFGSLEDHMKQYSTYSAGTPQADIDQQMQDVGVLQPGDGPFQAKTEEVSKLSSEGTIEFTGKKEVPDLDGLTETNYLPRLRTAELLGAEGAETVKEIKRIAIQSGWDKKINGVSTMDMAGKPAAYFEDLLRVADKNNVSDYTFLEDSLSAAQVREADPEFWQDDVKLATFSANTLEAFLSTGKFKDGTPEYKAINSYLTIRRVQEGNADVSALAGAGSQKIDQFILSNKNNLDKDQLNTLTDMRSIAEEYEAEGQERATAKQMAQEGYISAQGVEALEGQARFEAMANFEKAWKIATDTTEADPQFWQKPEELAKIDPVVLKTMMDAGLLGETTSEAYQSVEATYNAKSGVLAGDLSQLQGKSVVQFDQYMVSNADYFVDNPAAATEFHKLRSLQLAREKADAPDERLLTAKQIGLDAFMDQNNTSELSGDALMNKMAEFEKIWDAASKEVAAKAETYTTSNYAADLIKFGGMLVSENEVDRKTADDWFVTTKPLIDETLASIANLDNAAKIAALVEGGIPKDRATAIVNGTIKQTSVLGRPVLVDTATGQQFSVLGQESLSDTRNRIAQQSLTQEELEEQRIAQDEMDADLGFSGRLDNLTDVAAAFGPESWTGKLVNGISEVFNTTLMPDSAEASSTLISLGKVTKFNIISGFAGLRDSVSLKAEVQSLIPTTGQFFGSKKDALRKFKNVKALLDQAILSQTAISKSQSVTTTKNSNAEVALLSLIPLAELYGKVVSGMQGGGGTSDVVTDSVFKPAETQTETPPAETSNPYQTVTEDLIKQFSFLTQYKGKNIRIITLPNGKKAVEVEGE